MFYVDLLENSVLITISVVAFIILTIGLGYFIYQWLRYRKGTFVCMYVCNYILVGQIKHAEICCENLKIPDHILHHHHFAFIDGAFIK